MKKLVLMLLCMPATMGWAYDFEANGVYYNITSSVTPRTCAVTYNDSITGPSYTGSVTIPSSASDGKRTYKVTAIADSAFAGCTKLTSISITTNVETIGANAFENCTGLKSFTIPSKVKELNEQTFAGCTKLRTLWCPATLCQPRENTFEGVSKELVKVYIPINAVATYQADNRWNTFTNLIGYTTINYTSTDSILVKPYKTPAFLDEEGNGLNIILNSYSKSSDKGTMRVDGVAVALGDSAFWGRSTLKELKLDENVQQWGADAMTGTDWWENQPAGMYYKGTTAYKYKAEESALSLKVKEGTTAIGANALSDTTTLQYIFLPASVESIGNNAFAGCTSLKAIYCEAIPAQADSLTFAGIDTATCTIKVPQGSLAAYEVAPYWKDMTNLVEYQTSVLNYYSTDSLIVTPYNFDAFLDSVGNALMVLSNEYNEEGGTITLDGQLAGLGYAAFAERDNLQRIILNSNVKTIGDSAFVNCANMTKVTMRTGVETIGEGAFEGCSAIAGINIARTVKEIGKRAFAGCKSATFLYLPTEGATLADSVFIDCYLMTSVTVTNDNPGTITNKTFSASMKWLDVPYGCYKTFKSDKNWGRIPMIVESGDVEVEEVSKMEDFEILEGDKIQLLAVALPEEASKATIAWKTSDPKVATVDANGVVKAISVGQATITAMTYTKNVKSSSCTVTVNPIKAAAIGLSESSSCLYVGESLQLDAVILPENTTEKSIVWTTSDEKVASVKDGQVIATGVGSAVITAQTTDGTALSATCTITVLPVLATQISLNKEDEAMLQGDSLQLVATLTPENVTFNAIEWTSSDETIATVQDGLVIARGGGLVVITAMSTDGSKLKARCIIEITAVQSISSIANDDQNESYYDMNGAATTKQHRGLTIVRKADGKVQKIMIK